jgi:hypothetical protein
MDLSHGDSKVELLDDIINITLKGSFNEEGVGAFVDKLKEIINSLNGKPFYVLIDFLAVDGGTPEAFTASNSYNLWLSKQNMIAKASVGPPILVAIDQSQIHESSRKGQTFKYFNDYDSALIWLKSQK